MYINGNKGKAVMLSKRLNQIASKNFAFKLVWDNITRESITVTIGGEQELIDDPHNTSKTIKEFRSYCLMGNIFLFYTKYETDESLVHLFLHELCHIFIQKNPYTFHMMQAMTGNKIVNEGYDIDISEQFWASKKCENIIKSNDIHDSLPEETLCDDFASSMLGFRYDRSWWMNRWEEIDNP